MRSPQQEAFGYTNENNPFNDPSLTTAFVWKKKHERDKAEGRTVKQQTKHQLREKQIRLQDEIEKIKKARIAREAEQAEMEEMKLQMQREADYEANLGWEEREEEFHRKQAKLRTKLRIEAGREKAIDILAKNLNFFNGEDADAPDADIAPELDVELTEPHLMFVGLGLK